MEPNSTSAPADTQEVKSPETIVQNPTPDSEIVKDDGRYDSEFSYLASPATGEKKEAVPSSDKEEKPTSEVPEKEDAQKIDVPPIESVEPVKEDTSKETVTDWEKRYKDLQSFSDSNTSTLKKRVSELELEVQALNQIKLAKEEIEKEPLAFIYKHVPELAEKVDPNRYILDKLRAEFGSEFAYDPSEAYVEGTQSYKFRARENELRDQLSRERLNSEFARQEKLHKEEARLNESKMQVMKEYGLTEEQFQKEIIEWSKAHPADFNVIAKIRYFDWHISKATKEALKSAKRDRTPAPPPSVANVGGGESTEKGAEAYNEMKELFGDI